MRSEFAALYPNNPNFRPPVPQPAPAPTPLRAPAAAPATAAPGGTPIVFNFGPRSYSVIAPGRAEAEALARELERLYQVSGGG